MSTPNLVRGPLNRIAEFFPYQRLSGVCAFCGRRIQQIGAGIRTASRKGLCPNVHIDITAGQLRGSTVNHPPG